MNSLPHRSTLAGLALISLPCLAAADDIEPPWWRGAPLTVSAAWEFPVPPQDWLAIAPDAVSSVGSDEMPSLFFDGFETHAQVDHASNWTWVSADGDGGITPDTGVPSAVVAFHVANWVDDMLAKVLRAQITWTGQDPPEVFALTGFKAADSIHGFILDGPTLVDDTHLVIDWMIFGWNPDWELLEISVPQGTSLDEVVIDTWSYFPAPGTAAILGIALIALAPRTR